VSKIKGYFIVGAICLLVGSAVTFAIAKGYSDKLIERMSNQLAESEARNKRITEENSQLAELNRQSKSTIDGLEKQLADSYRQSKKTIDGIRKSIDEATRGLEGAGNGIDEIIAGIEAIKNIIRALP